MVELLFPLTLREDMKDVFILPRGLGLWGVQLLRFVTPLLYLYYQILTGMSSPLLTKYLCSIRMPIK